MSRQIVILGAGISGLTAAWKLEKQLNPETKITIVEKSPRVGGWIHSLRKEGFLFEQGPRSCRTKGSGEETLKLLEELGLEDQVIVAEPSARFRYLYSDRKLQKLPHNLPSFLLSPLMKGVIPSLWKEWRTDPKEGDRSIYSFISDRFGSHIAEQFIDPLVTGIYAGDIRNLSIQSCFPVLFDLEQEYGSITRGMLFKRKRVPHSSPFVSKIRKTPLFSLKGGMESIITALANRLQSEIRLNCFAEQIEYEKEGAVITLNTGEILHTDHLISTLPQNEINYATVAVVSFGYRKKVLKDKGFGYLIPSKENESILGCVWDSSVFPKQNPEGTTVLSIMMGGARWPQIEIQSESDCIATAQVALQRHMNIDEKPDVTAFKVAKQAIPQYPVNHLEWVKKVRAETSPFFTQLGTAFGGVSVNDCVANSIQFAERFCGK